MLITQPITWEPVNWPATTAATQYTILQVYPTPVAVNQTVTNQTMATLTFDDSLSYAFQVRPSSGSGLSLVYGPEVTVFTMNYVPCRAWLRNDIREALADRVDTALTTTPKWPDDELNNYIREALSEFNLMFPADGNPTTITLLPVTTDTFGNVVGVRNYALPLDFFLIRTVEYVTEDGKLHLYLKEKPWRGGETTATSFMGFPKLGIVISPMSGRYYPGHFYIYQKQIWLDFDPPGNGDTLNLTYLAKRPLPVNDADVMSVEPEDMSLFSLYVQMKCWLRVEGQDASLSRWRSKEDGGRRDDLSTAKQSYAIKQLYDQRVNDRRELRVKTKRLVRR